MLHVAVFLVPLRFLLYRFFLVIFFVYVLHLCGLFCTFAMLNLKYDG